MRPIGTARYRRYSLFAHVTIILRRFRGDANRELPPAASLFRAFLFFFIPPIEPAFLLLVNCLSRLAAF